MDCTEAYKEHIMYSFNGFCKVVIRYAAINAWRDRNRRRQREISFEYLTEEKFYPLSTSDEALKSPYEQYPVTICGQTIILTNGELAAALLSLPVKRYKCDMQSAEKDRVGQQESHLHKDHFRDRLQVCFRGITTG